MLNFVSGLFFIALIAVLIHPQQVNDAQQIAAIKAVVAKIRTGTKAVVEVTRRGQPKVKGYINRIYEDRFEVISTQNGSIGVDITIYYDEVLRIKGKGVDWRSVGMKSGIIGLKAFKVMHIILKGACLGPISRCSP
ncbi:MAG TPA: hypothetical protein VF251_11290 [Pyrinomonadaceae bacterium]